MEKNTKQLITILKTISNDALMQHLVGNTFCGIIAETADRLEELERKVTGLEKVAEHRLDLLDRQSKQIADLQAYRQPLSEAEISKYFFVPMLNLGAFIAAVRAIEKAHGISGDV